MQRKLKKKQEYKKVEKLSPYLFPGVLIQEQLPTQWHILVAAILLNQSRRSVVWDNTLYKLFELWPTPEALAKSDDRLETLLQPHGFQNVKAKRLRRMCEDFLEWDGVDAKKLHGVGQYAFDAHRIFVKGERPDPDTVKDGHLLKFLRQEWTDEEKEVRRSAGLYTLVPVGEVHTNRTVGV